MMAAPPESRGVRSPNRTMRVPLSPRQRLSFAAHLFKALARQHHGALRPLLGDHVGPGAVVVDAGAHAGQFTKLFAALAPGGRVYAFEPGAYARRILDTVVRFKRLDNVEVVAAALGDEDGEATLTHPLKARGSLGFGLAHLGGDGEGGGRALCESVPVTTLDRFAGAAGLRRLDFVKADVEGWEVRLVRGARATLERFRPALLLELGQSHLARAGDAPEEAWRLLGPLGYHAFRLSGPPAPVAGFAGDADYLFVADDV